MQWFMTTSHLKNGVIKMGFVTNKNVITGFYNDSLQPTSVKTLSLVFNRRRSEFYNLRIGSQ